MKPTAVLDRIIVQPKKAEEKTKTGIYIPSDTQENPYCGPIVAVGPDVKHARVGNIAHYSPRAGTERGEFLCMRENDLLFVEE